MADKSKRVSLFLLEAVIMGFSAGATYYTLEALFGG